MHEDEEYHEFLQVQVRQHPKNLNHYHILLIIEYYGGHGNSNNRQKLMLVLACLLV